MKKSSYEIVEYIADIHKRDDIYDEDSSDLLERVVKYSCFELQDISVDEIDIDWHCDDYLVDKYMEYTSEAPPIVIESNKQTIIDGTHRVMVCKHKGIKTVKAYVGKV